MILFANESRYMENDKILNSLSVSDNNRKKCLLIGGSGFLGQNIADRFAAEYQVDIWDVNSKKDYYANENIYAKCFDYYKETVEVALLDDYEFIVLLVCSINPGSSKKAAEESYSKEIEPMVRLLDSMCNSRCKRLVFISSGGTVYGNQDREILSENAPTIPLNHYGIIKLAQERILLMYNELFNMNNIVLRLANPYGMGQSIGSGIGAVTVFLEKVLLGETIQIWGDGNNVRDYIWIEDVTEVIFRMLEKRCSFKDPVFNIGTGVGTSLNSLVDIIEIETAMKASVEYQEPRDVDVRRNVLDNRKLKSIIGEYKFVGIGQGIKRYLKYIREK